MPPVGPAIALPARGTQRVRPHAQPHAELEDAGEGTVGGQSGDERLQDADARMDLHDAYQTQDGVRGHHAVGVEHDCVGVQRTPALAEVAQVARLEPGPAFAASVGDRNDVAEARRKVRCECFLVAGDVGAVAVAEDVQMEVAGFARADDAFEHPGQVARQACDVFVAHADRQGGAALDRLVAGDAAQVRSDRTLRVAHAPHQDQPDDGVPEADRGPGQCQTEHQQHGDAQCVGPVRKQRVVLDVRARDQGGEPRAVRAQRRVGRGQRGCVRSRSAGVHSGR